MEQYPEAYQASAYDDPLVIAGNATLGREIAGFPDPFRAVLAPIGGGGLTAGLIQGLRLAQRPLPVWAVEPQLANDASRSFRQGRLVSLEVEPRTMADGVRTTRLGQHNWNILQHGLSGVLEVTESSIADAVRLLFETANVKAEPTGALGIAALLCHPQAFRNQMVCCVVSGGNVDNEVFGRLLRGWPD
jgi:threonine dehydratase